jgi:hypothetical protein
MSRILRRPMFRGGPINEGIMSGVVKREKHAEEPMVGDLQKSFGEYKNILRSVLPQQPSVDPLAKFLISGGLKGLSTAGKGGTLANLAYSFEKPTEQLFTDLAAQDKTGQSLDLTAAELAIKGKQALDVEKAKAKKAQFAAETFAERFRVKFNKYSDSTDPLIKGNASMLSAFETRAEMQNVPIVPLDYTYDNKTQKSKPDYNVLQPGTYAIDLTRKVAVYRDPVSKKLFDVDPNNLTNIIGLTPVSSKSK